MKQLKKALASCLALILALGVLAGCGGKPGNGTGSSGNDGAPAYVVLVNDEAGNPVPGVTIQFCSDTECIMGTTDENGAASFDKEAGSYTIHILKAPEAYAPDDTEYAAPEQPGPVTLVLKAAESEAAEEKTEAKQQSVFDSARLGLHYEAPEKYLAIKGCLGLGTGSPDIGLLRMEWDYFALPEDRFDEYTAYLAACGEAVRNGEEIPEAPDPGWQSRLKNAPLYTVFAINGSRGEDELRALLREYNAPYGDDLSWLEKVKTDGDTSFFVGQYAFVEEDLDKYREAMGDYFPEFEDLYRDKETFLSSQSYRLPEWQTDLAVGETISFETTDLDGNPVSSADVFAESKVTMINVWGTWCPPCKVELPELAKMAKDFEAQGCRIIGICHDAYMSEKTELAKQLLQDAEADYLCLTGSPELAKMLQVQAFPTTFYVDSEGRLLLEPVVGALIARYPEAVAEALALVG